ncbi:hypothetical protein BO83DRAFT_379956 [Aspergillus eucalypticola CBS 122712]|uniref:Uncharacterized protein n=1 Tax=Aspergillus eucalypticola (strain CBS 122712 / IBT 29274) TaxID=1448314 RepID=A0A317V357_ASPEC|nr:uncharacterized protein BO83DRAFT_379956 [Aspergillus eucalypticola CBS 122712]PWY68704.1 hypothetical protein BO83DRAFT_379956 [Aspergillus eucalypticola CBS 122712]
MTWTDTVRSILCEGPWIWNDGSSEITFHEDGTGKLFCSTEYTCWIFAEFEWKSHNSAYLNQTIDLGNGRQQSKVIGDFTIEMTLTKRRPHDIWYKGKVNENWLNEGAFCAKTYHMTIEHGRFRSQFDVKHKILNGSLYALRIVFVPSPFPPDEEWNDESYGPHAMRLWECTEFNSRKYPNERLGLWETLMAWCNDRTR